MSLLTGIVAASLLTTQPASHADVNLEVPLHINRYGLYTVDVNVGRQVLFSGDPEAEPIPFIIDTGASHTAVPRLIAQQLVDRELITLDLVGHGMTGQFDTDLVFIDQLDFGLGPRNAEVAIFEEAYGSVMSAAGLLGSNVFEGDVIQLDFPRQSLSRLSGRFAQGSPDLRLYDGLIVGTASIRGIDGPVHVIVDTGATASLANTALAHARGGNVRTTETVVWGVSGAESRSESRKLLSRFRLDNFCIDLFEITVTDVYVFDHHGWSDQPAMVLGMDVLNNAVITVDHQTGHVAIEGVENHSCLARRADYSITIQR